MKTIFRLIQRISAAPFVGVALFLFAAPVFADMPIISDTTGVVGGLCNILNWMFWILLAVSVIMVMWAGYLYVTARDDAEQITKAKKTIFYAAIGIVVALLAKGFPGFVGSIFGQSIYNCSATNASLVPPQ